VPEFLAEVYVSSGPGNPAGPSLDEVSLAADLMTRDGIPVRLSRFIYVPQDETCFYLFEAQSGDAVAETALRCGLRVDRVTEAVSGVTGRESRVDPSAGTPVATAATTHNHSREES